MPIQPPETSFTGQLLTILINVADNWGILGGIYSMRYSEWEEIFRLGRAELWPYLGEGTRLRERRCGDRGSFCVIINPKS